MNEKYAFYHHMLSKYTVVFYNTKIRNTKYRKPPRYKNYYKNI